MPCYSPLDAYQCYDGSVVFVNNLRRHDIRRTMQLPCGQCIGCKLERSRQWAVRCMHEASMHQHNAFITLTYDDAHIPPRGQLNHTEYQKFMRRLRKNIAPKQVRFFMCGEYGELNGRPHYHAALFGHDFNDKLYWMKSPSGQRLYRSATLERLWPYGHSTTADVTFESAAYIARYCTKKITGDAANTHYKRTDSEGEYQLTPEYGKMSLKPGIGATWYDKYKNDVYPHDYVITNSKECKPPKYYDILQKRENPDNMEDITHARETRAREKYLDNTPERLKAKETVQKAKSEFLKRNKL